MVTLPLLARGLNGEGVNHAIRCQEWRGLPGGEDLANKSADAVRAEGVNGNEGAVGAERVNEEKRAE